MESSFSPSVIEDALVRLDPQDVIELIDYRTESMQRMGDLIRCYCPIHKDYAHRSLTIVLSEKSYSCSDPVCPGSRGGSLIELYALAVGRTFDDALQALADEFGFALAQAASHDSLERSMAEAHEFIARAEKEPKKRDHCLQEAEKRFRTVLSVRPEDPIALLCLYNILKEEGNFLELGKIAGQLLSLAQGDAAKEDEAIARAREYLEFNPVDIVIRGRVAEHLVTRDRTEDAVSELISLADTAEQAGQLEFALDAYQRIAHLRTDVIDVHPMIVNLLVALHRPQDAARQIVGRANWLREHGHFLEGAETLLNVLDLEPENVPVRFEALKLFVQAGLPGDALERCIALADGIGERNETVRHLKSLRALGGAKPDDIPVLERLSVAERLNGYSTTATELELKLATRYLATGNHDGALLLLEQIRNEMPKDTRVLRALAEVHHGMGDREVALEELDEAAAILESTGMKEELLEVAERAIAFDPENHEHRITLASLLEDQGHKERARTMTTELCAELEKDQRDAALADALTVLARLEPEEPRHLLRIAEAHSRLANVSRAIDARMNAAKLLMTNGRFDHAEAQLRLVLEEAPKTLEARRMLVEALGKMGRAQETAAAVLELADTFSERQQYAEAKELVEALLAGDPGNLDALSRLGDLSAELGDEAGFIRAQMKTLQLQTEQRMYDLAIETGEDILKLEKNHDEALAALGGLYEMRGDRERMVEYMQRRIDALRASGDRVKERAAVSDLLARDSKNRRAIERAAFLDFESGNVTEGLARLDEFTAGATPLEATTALRELILRNPEELGLHTRIVAHLRRAGSRDDLAAALQALILVHERAERWREAVAIYREVLSISPDSVILRMALVEAMKRLGDRASAIGELLRLAELHERQDNDDDALGVYEQAERLDQFDERAFRGQAEILKRRGRNDLAAGRLKTLADSLASEGRRADAIRVMQNAASMDPANRDARRALIAIYVEEGRLDDAISELLLIADSALADSDEESHISHIREAAGLKPADVDLRKRLIRALEECERPGDAAHEAVSLAETLFAAGNAQEALRTLDEAVARQPDNLRARKIRAEIYLSQGEDKLALAEFRQMTPYLDSVGSVAGIAPSSALQIMPEYVFATFVVGARNNFAFATAKAVAKSPGTAYNPVFLYADVGLGKTHLLHAIANSMTEANPSIRITYTNVEDFTAELIQAIETNTVAQWRQRHKSADVLLIDDVQFLAAKERSQEELFHIFNTLFQSKRQIVVTSDRPPKDLVHLEKRLKSRFGAGVVVDIQSPDVETRVAIVRREMQLRHSQVTLPDDVARSLAERMDSNVRELKGALNQVVLAHELGGAALNTALVQQTIDKLFAAQA